MDNNTLNLPKLQDIFNLIENYSRRSSRRFYQRAPKSALKFKNSDFSYYSKLLARKNFNSKCSLVGKKDSTTGRSDKTTHRNKQFLIKKKLIYKISKQAFFMFTGKNYKCLHQILFEIADKYPQYVPYIQLMISYAWTKHYPKRKKITVREIRKQFESDSRPISNETAQSLCIWVNDYLLPAGRAKIRLMVFYTRDPWTYIHKADSQYIDRFRYCSDFVPNFQVRLFLKNIFNTNQSKPGSRLEGSPDKSPPIHSTTKNFQFRQPSNLISISQIVRDAFGIISPPPTTPPKGGQFPQTIPDCETEHFLVENSVYPITDSFNDYISNSQYLENEELKISDKERKQKYAIKAYYRKKALKLQKQERIELFNRMSDDELNTLSVFDMFQIVKDASDLKKGSK